MRPLPFIATLLCASVAQADSYAATFQRYLDAVACSDTERREALEDEPLDSYGELSREEQKAMAGRYARVRFLSLEPRWKACQELRLDAKTLKADLMQKVKAQQELQQAWLAIVALRDPEQSVASLVRIGQSYAELAVAYCSVPPPLGLTVEQAELFRSEMKKQCPPLEERAKESFRAALKLAKEHGISTEASRMAAEQLTRYEKAP